MSRLKVDPQSINPHFVTCSIVEWLPVFISEKYFRIITDSLKHCHNHKALAVNAYVVMPTHFHAILTAQENQLSDIVRDFKRHTSRKISEQLQTDGNQVRKSSRRASSGRNATTFTTIRDERAW
jgi:REP element-mobilizing transposase RayT